MSKIILKKSSVVDKIPLPADLAYGELALNYADSKLFFKKPDNTIGTFSAGSALQNRYSYTATAAQTTFSASYTPPYVDVYLNGLRLSSGVDYTATSGSSIVLTPGASVNDLVEIVAQVVSTTVLVDATKLALAGGTMTGVIGFAAGQTFPGTQTALVSGASIKTINGTSVLGSGNIEIDVGVTSFNTRTGAVTLSSTDVTTALGFTPVTQTAVDSSISALVDSAPGTLDTLNELAAALGDDPNFATTVSTSIAARLPLAGGTMTGAIGFAGAQTWPTFNQSTTGNAATATTLQTARTINGVSFNGSADITVADSTKLPLAGGTLTGASTVSVASWVKWTLETTGTTAKARQGSDANGLNFTSNALWDGSWTEDDSTKKKFAYIQHLGNGRHEFRTAASGTGISWVTSLTVDETAVNSLVALQQSGNQVLHAGNYNTYALPLAGGTMTGAIAFAGAQTWPTFNQSTTGNAATATTLQTARTLTIGATGKSFNGSANVAWSRAEIEVPRTTTSTNHGIETDEACIAYVSGISLFGQTDGALYSQVYSNVWKHQIFGDYRTGQLAIRGRNSGTWQAWRTVLDSTNYTSYSPTLTGTGASGSWGISVTGTSASAPLLSALGNYVWSQSTLPNSYNLGIQSAFVGPAAGEGAWQNYGSVMTVRTYSGGGGSLQLYTPYSPSNGGTGLQVRFGNYDVSSGNAWTAWKTLLASDNFSNYALPLSGGSLTGSLTLTGNSTSIRQNSTASWSGDAPNGVGKLEYHSNRWYINAGADSTEIANFRRGASSVATISNTGVYSGSIAGNAATATLATSATSATSATFVSSPDGDRTAGNKLPTTNPRSVRFDFANAGSVTGASGNYAGVMTYAPWDGTSASTGDSSYQLAFTNQSGSNASGPPQLLIRNGINSTWNSWHTIITTASTQSAPRATRANGFFYIDDNFGVGVVGNYNASRYQTVYAMGDAYKMAADGASLANMYGIAWSHPNAGGAAGNLTDHGLLIINNGGFRCAISNSIVASGNITAYSDERLKTNWQAMPENFVARLAKVKVGIYDRIDTENGTQVGVSAQSFQELLPQAIITAKDEMQTLSVSYGNAALASAVELAKDNCELRARIERLESLINTILNKD
jgi:hypothetical protein